MSEQQKGDQGEELTERTVKIAGIEHTMLLNDEDAKRYEEAERYDEEATKAGTSETKAKTPANKGK